MAFILIGGSNCMVINLSLYKIQLENGELYKSSKGGRVQHYKSQEKAEAKIKKLGDIAAGATVVESKAKTVATTEIKNSEENTTDSKVVKVSKAKKASAKTEKAKKAKKNKNI